MYFLAACTGVPADSQPKLSGLVLGRRPLGTVLQSSNEPGELLQWLCHDDSTINIVLDIILLLLRSRQAKIRFRSSSSNPLSSRPSSNPSPTSFPLGQVAF